MLSALLDLLRESVDVFASAGYAVLATLIGVGISFLLILAVELGFEAHRFGGQHLVVCPHRGVQARVKVRSVRAALWTAVTDDPPLRVRSCSLEATRPTCDQACVERLRGTCGQVRAEGSGPEVRI